MEFILRTKNFEIKIFYHFLVQYNALNLSYRDSSRAPYLIHTKAVQSIRNNSPE